MNESWFIINFKRKMNMKNYALKATLLAMTLLLGVLLTLAGCGAAETASAITSNVDPSSPDINNPSPITPNVDPSVPISSPPELIEKRLTYKPFAEGHDDKFSLGDFDSPYLLQLADGMADFTIDNGSEILLNGVAYGVVKTNYQGNSYLGIADFSFSEYASFTKANAEVNLQVSLVLVNRNAIVIGAISNSLVVSDPRAIYTWMDLQGMKHDLAADYELRNGITFPTRGSEGLPMEGFEPVGDNTAGNHFTGSFAGNGHRITGLSIERSKEHVGIWGYVSSANSVIKDFVLDHGGIEGNWRVGGVVGTLESGIVTNVGMMSSGDMRVSANSFVGGLVGVNAGTVAGYTTGAVTGTRVVGGLVGVNFGTGTAAGYATGRVSGNSFVGGLVGWNFNGNATGYATGAVSGSGNWVGGLVGWNDGNATGYATGAVSGSGFVGGLVGWNDGTGTATGYATGTVNGNAAVGGLVGYNNDGTAVGYWDIGSTGQNNSAGGTTGISAIANVVYDSLSATYTDTGNGNAVMFNNAFLMHFNLPGASATWPTLNAEDSFPRPPSP